MNLEIGGGPHPARPDWTQFDAIDWSERTGLNYVIGDARELPWPDETFDRVFSSNLLEHFLASETDAVLSEWTRVLAPGGTLELVVPDSIGILRDFFEGRNNWEDCAERLRGSRDYEGNEHKQAFCYWEFPEVIARIPALQLELCERSHRNGGVHAVCRKR